jgi:hypothetical protein
MDTVEAKKAWEDTARVVETTRAAFGTATIQAALAYENYLHIAAKYHVSDEVVFRNKRLTVTGVYWDRSAELFHYRLAPLTKKGAIPPRYIPGTVYSIKEGDLVPYKEEK